MEASIDVDFAKFDAALSATLAASKREPMIVIREQAKGVVRRLVDITPPAHEGVRGIEARRHGEALVESNIRGIYGTPDQAMELIKAGSSPDDGMAKGYWRHLKRGEFEDAAVILRAVTGRGLAPFDGGKQHQALKRGRARPRNKGILYYVTDPKQLDAYISEIKGRVGWLAAGWNQAAASLGVQPPQWIWRHNAPGKVIIRETDARFEVLMTNEVKYAREAADLQRRLQWAVDQQAAAMERRTANMLEQILKRAGFVVSGVLG